MKLKSKIEAILFLSDKPIKAAAIARIVSEDVQVVRQSLLELIHDYEERDGGLEITDDDGYLIQVRDAYAAIVDEFAPMEMPVALVRTLSAIAIKQPVAQSEIIKIRGAGAYDHIKELILRDLISKKEEGGRSPMLGTTKKFQEYFRLTQDAKMLRTQLSDETKAARKAAEGESGDESDHGGDFAPLDHEQEIAARAGVVAEHTEGSPDIAEALEIAGAAEASDEGESELRLESKIDLEKVFATSPDASFVFRPPADPVKASIASRDYSVDSEEKSDTSEDSSEKSEDQTS